MRSREGQEDNACFLNIARDDFSAQSYYLTPSSFPLHLEMKTFSTGNLSFFVLFCFEGRHI